MSENSPRNSYIDDKKSQKNQIKQNKIPKVFSSPSLDAVFLPNSRAWRTAGIPKANLAFGHLLWLVLGMRVIGTVKRDCHTRMDIIKSYKISTDLKLRTNSTLEFYVLYIFVILCVSLYVRPWQCPNYNVATWIACWSYHKFLVSRYKMMVHQHLHKGTKDCFGVSLCANSRHTQPFRWALLDVFATKVKGAATLKTTLNFWEKRGDPTVCRISDIGHRNRASPTFLEVESGKWVP